MNDLNSIIIEGEVIDKPKMDSGVCTFRVKSKRLFKSKDGQPMEEVSVFPTESHSKLAEACEKHLSEGRSIRVVGRLKSPDGCIFTVVAEHVEFKPMRSIEL